MELFDILLPLIGTVVFAILAPILGCLLAGIDRVLSARMQGRVGPPILQPYYDVRKLLDKERVTVNSVQDTYVVCALIFAFVAGGIFFTGGNILMCVFVITLSSLFFIIAAYSSRSPYSEVGAARETLQVMSYEPMVLLFAVGFYMASAAILVPEGISGLDEMAFGSFDAAVIFQLDLPVVVYAPLIFLGLLFILTIKLRKSPFDLSMSHHAHQEIVRGTTTEMSGRTLALVEILHWCENVLFLGWVCVFFIWNNPLSILLGIVVAAIVYFLEIMIDNNFARVKWQFMLKSSWIVALVAGGINIAVLAFI